METIASFQIDHDVLTPGLYMSRTDGDVVTYDLRFVRPNTPPFLSTASMHTIEHLFATYVRNSRWKNGILYFGPMGCRTGFYFLTRCAPHPDAVPAGEAIALTRDALAFIASYTGDIPGASPAECGNWREHDLDTARRDAAALLSVLAQWDESHLLYPVQKRESHTL